MAVAIGLGLSSQLLQQAPQAHASPPVDIGPDNAITETDRET